MADLELAPAQRAFLIWQIIIGLVGLLPAGIVLIYTPLFVFDVIFGGWPNLKIARLDEAAYAFALWLLVLAGFVLWVGYLLFLFRPSTRRRLLPYVSIGTLVVNPCMAVLMFILFYFAPSFLALVGLYQLIITIIWYVVFPAGVSDVGK